MTETNRESFIFYRSFFEALLDMDKESQADCLMAIADYALNGKNPKMTPAVRMFFTLIKPQLDANQKKYESGCKGAEFGKFGGRPKKNPKETPKKPQENPKETPNDNDNVNVNVYKKENLIKEKSESVDKFLTDFKSSHSVNSFNKNKILISNSFSLFSFDDPDIKAYIDEYGEKVIKDVQDWLIKNKLGKEVDKAFICRQFNNFAQRQSK